MVPPVVAPPGCTRTDTKVVHAPAAVAGHGVAVLAVRPVGLARDASARTVGRHSTLAVARRLVSVLAIFTEVAGQAHEAPSEDAPSIAVAGLAGAAAVAVCYPPAIAGDCVRVLRVLASGACGSRSTRYGRRWRGARGQRERRRSGRRSGRRERRGGRGRWGRR